MRTPKQELYGDDIQRVGDEKSRNTLMAMCRYVDKTKGVCKKSLINYDLTLSEYLALRDMAACNLMKALFVAFLYGRAKGLRVAKQIKQEDKP